MDLLSGCVLPFNMYFNLQVFHKLKLGGGQNITALALNNDNTNLLVSTVDKQLIIFTDPAVSRYSIIFFFNSLYSGNCYIIFFIATVRQKSFSMSGFWVERTCTRPLLG